MTSEHAFETIKRMDPSRQKEFEAWQEIVRQQYNDDAPAFVQRMAAVIMREIDAAKVKP